MMQPDQDQNGIILPSVVGENGVAIPPAPAAASVVNFPVRDEDGVVIPPPAPAIVDRLIDPPAFGFSPVPWAGVGASVGALDRELQAALEASFNRVSQAVVGGRDPELKAALEASENELLQKLAAQDAKDREERERNNQAQERAALEKWSREAAARLAKKDQEQLNTVLEKTKQEHAAEEQRRKAIEERELADALNNIAIAAVVAADNRDDELDEKHVDENKKLCAPLNSFDADLTRALAASKALTSQADQDLEEALRLSQQASELPMVERLATRQRELEQSARGGQQPVNPVTMHFQAPRAAASQQKQSEVPAPVEHKNESAADREKRRIAEVRAETAAQHKAAAELAARQKKAPQNNRQAPPK